MRLVELGPVGKVRVDLVEVGGSRLDRGLKRVADHHVLVAVQGDAATEYVKNKVRGAIFLLDGKIHGA